MMLIKVCGMRYADNILGVCKLQPNYIGFVFYPGSPRFAGGMLTPWVTVNIPGMIKRTGVFVNAPEKQIMETVTKFSLNAVQLHGNESPGSCKNFKNRGLEVLKTLHVNTIEQIKATSDYIDACDFFLFDTPSANHGGTGQKFDWSVLERYEGGCPYFLSGGIGPDDAELILGLKNISPAGIDVNSRFELEPGLKNLEIIEEFIKKIREAT